MKGWRTILLNVGGAILQVAAALKFANPEVNMILGLVQSVGGVILRVVTNTPVGQSTPSA